MSLRERDPDAATSRFLPRPAFCAVRPSTAHFFCFPPQWKLERVIVHFLAFCRWQSSLPPKRKLKHVITHRHSQHSA